MVKPESIAVIPINGAIVNGIAKPKIHGIANGVAATKNGIVANGAAANGNGICHEKLQIRPGKAEDAKQLRALIQELADHQEMPDGPRIGAAQIEADFRSGAMHSMVAVNGQGEMAAYAVYYLQPSSSQRGQIVHLEDLYIRPQYRRRGLGIKLLRELAKFAHSQRLPCLEWNVLRNNYGAIKFYNTLPGLEDLTDRKETNKSICWRLCDHAFGHILRKAAARKGSDKEIQILLDQPGQIDESTADHLSAQWEQLTGQQLNARARKQLQAGHLGAIVVRQRKNGSDERKQHNTKVMGIAFFHRKAYSTWQGRFPELDQIQVAEDSRRKGVGTAIMAELVKMAQQMNATKVQWTAPEPSKAKSQHVPFFNSLKASDLTEAEQWLLYRCPSAGLLSAAEKENCRTEKDSC